MNTLTVRAAGLIALRRCPVRWCVHYGNDVSTDHTHYSDLPSITLALEGGTDMPEEYRNGDTPDSFEPGDYGLPFAFAELVQHPDEAPHMTIDTFNVHTDDLPRFTLDEAEQLRDQLDALLSIARKMCAR